jgi:hypothetical protein
MKRSLYLTLLLSMLLSTCGKDKGHTTEPETTPAKLKWLKTSGATIVDEDGKAMILRGVNRSGLEYDKTGAGVSQAELQYIVKEWKAQIIRLPFNQDWIMRDPAYVVYFNTVINWIVEAGAYVLLDLQWKNSTEKIPPIPDEEAITMWKNLAGQYKDNPAILFDIHNEAHDVTWEAWRQRAGQIIEAIKSVHPRALLFVSGLDWAYDLRGWGEAPLPYTNVVYSTHPYPFKAEPWAWDKYFGQYVGKIPVFAGEFGGGDSDLEWGRKILDYFSAKKMGWTSWSWSNEPYLTLNDRRTPTAFGKLVQAALAQNAGANSTLLQISQLQALYIGKDIATISWQTNEDSDSKVKYGLTTGYTDSVTATALLKSHSVKLTNLKPGTRYFFRAFSRDILGYTASSKDSTFSTLP